MIIQCEACKTKFRVGDDKIKPPGIKVRCSKCGEVFFFEYSLHDQHGNEPEVNPFEEEKQEEVVTDNAQVDDNVLPIKQDDPGIETPAETAGFDPPAKTEEQIDTSGIEEAADISADPGIDNTDQPDQDIEIDTSADTPDDKSDAFLNLEIDHLDDMAENQGVKSDGEQAEEFTPPAKEPETANQPIAREEPRDEFKSPELSLDQDILEQTYTKGTVATSSDIPQPRYAAASTAAGVKRYRRGKSGGGFFKKFFGWLLSIILLVALFLVAMFLLNETKIYPNNYFERFDSYTRSIYGGSEQFELKKNIKIKEVKGSWFSSKYGQVFVVSGEAVNTSANPVNYVKLRVYYISEGTNIFIQELYAGNTLSKREIKNSSFNSLQAKLNRKNGDISYDDAKNLDGLNFDIQSGVAIPFYSIFPAKEKILGLKYRVEVVGYESAEISKDP